MTGTTRNRNSKATAVAVAAATATVLIAARHARADLTLDLRPATGVTVQAGQAAPLELWLTGERTAILASVELELTSFAGSGSPAYVAQSPATDGFAESAVVNTHLNNVTDGSLLDNASLGFAAGTGTTGVPVGAEDLFLGTFWLGTPADVPGSYTVNVVSAELLDDGVAVIPAQTRGTTVSAIVPEPAAVALLTIPAAAVYARRRRPRETAHREPLPTASVHEKIA